MLLSVLACALSMLMLTPGSFALDNSVSLTPPMGWMTWQRFRCIVDCKLYPDDCISEKLIKKQADLMVSGGYLKAGYEYIVIDDCWLSHERDSLGRLQPDPDRFPSGIKALADYVHSKGLKFGIYEDYGTKTCGGYPGSLGYLEIDAQTFANWTVDYIKFDGCYVDISQMPTGYPEFGRYLNATGRPIVYSCSWPAYVEFSGKHPDYKAISESCNLWRNWGDIDDSWGSVSAISSWFAENQDRFASYAGPGRWNDPDMLLIGNFGLSYDQSKTQMAIWATMAAPLLMSVDLSTIKPESAQLLLNKDVIAINQDKLGIQGLRVYNKNSIEIWTKPVLPKVAESYSYGVAIVSKRTDGYPYPVNVTFSDIGLNATNGYKLIDLFEPANKLADPYAKSVFVKVNPTGVVFFRATPSTARKEQH